MKSRKGIGPLPGDAGANFGLERVFGHAMRGGRVRNKLSAGKAMVSIPSPEMRPDPYDPYAAYMPRRKPFYRRLWFILLVLLVLLPLVGGFGYYLKLKSVYGAKAAQFDFSQLKEMESASTIFDRNGNSLGRIFLENRDTVADFPYTLTQAVVGAEDNRFYQHHGIDLYGMFRAALKNWRAGHIKQGASTLTQQLARNTFALHERTYERKMTEIFLALEIEKRFSKQEIMTLYLNRVYFGSGFYGAQAAARGYFGKDVQGPESLRVRHPGRAS